jgi:hypothetical protein
MAGRGPSAKSRYSKLSTAVSGPATAGSHVGPVISTSWLSFFWTETAAVMVTTISTGVASTDPMVEFAIEAKADRETIIRKNSRVPARINEHLRAALFVAPSLPTAAVEIRLWPASDLRSVSRSFHAPKSP